MILGRVTDSVWGSRQTHSLEGCKLLTVRAETTNDAIAAGDEIVAIDPLSAGPGELVLVAVGSRVRDLTLSPAIATKAVVIAIVDDVAVSE